MRTTNSIDHRKEVKAGTPVESLASADLTIAEDGMEHIMGMLTNLYPNSVLAIFREYISNAYDSHVKAKVLGKKTVKVELYNSTEQTYVDVRGKEYPEFGVFSVQDFGVGMSQSDILETYSKYGKSTKGDNNDEIGGFGIGAKSALSIADRFDGISVQNGVEVKFYIAKERNGTGKLHVVSAEPTSAKNGVTITIPITEETFKRMVIITNSNFFRVWEEGSLEVNGGIPRNLGALYREEDAIQIKAGEQILGWAKLNKISKLQHKSYDFNPEPYSIGGIPYKRIGEMGDIEKYLKHNVGIDIVLNVPIGMVKLTPDRENIQDTEESRAIINTLFESTYANLATALKTRLNSLEPNDAYKFYAANALAMETGYFKTFNSWNTTNFTRHDDNFDLLPKISYRGEVIPATIPVGHLYDKGVLAFVSKTATSYNEHGRMIPSDFPLLSAVLLEGVNTFNYRPTSHLRRHYDKAYTPIFVYGTSADPKVETRKALTGNARSVAESNGVTNKYFAIYHAHENIAPPEAISNNILTYHIDDFIKVGRKYRSDAAKANAKNRVVRPRGKGIHYGIAYDAKTKKLIAKLFSNEELKEGKMKVAVIDQDLEYSHEGWWESLKTAITEEGDNWNVLNSLLFDKLKSLVEFFPTTHFILIPRTRKVQAVTKLHPSISTYAGLWEQEVKEMSASEKNLVARMSALMADPVSMLIVDKGLTHKLDDSPVKEALEAISSNHKHVSKIKLARQARTYGKSIPVINDLSVNSTYGNYANIGQVFAQGRIRMDLKIIVEAYNAITKMPIYAKKEL